jgi:putative two-component system response regulator
VNKSGSPKENSPPRPIPLPMIGREQPLADSRILAVDDEEMIRNVLRRMLEKAGYLCDTADSAGEAIGKMAKRPYAVVLTDIMMPGMSGMEFLELIRKRDDEIAVIMLTALNDIDLSIRALKAGAYDYITKPFRLDDVLVSIEKALQKRALILENRDYQENLELKVREQSRKIQTSFIKTIESLARTLEARDPETRDHSLRVTEYSIRTAEEMGLPNQEVENIRVAAALHDIGKLGVRERVLDKEQALRWEEVEHIHRHPLVAAEILGPIDELKEIILLIKHHHENFDGTGYPDRLAGEKIPLGSRIIAVADSFDAITSTRPYREAMSEEFAVGEIRKHSGGQFDPAVVAAFLRALGYARDAGERGPEKLPSLPRTGGG